MSRANLEGRQAQVDRNGGYVMGGFDEDGRQVVKKDIKFGKPADKPGFFLGGSDPSVPTGPKRKLRASWIAGGNNSHEEEKSSPPPIPTPTRKWTPPAKKAGLPPRSKTHDGTVNPNYSVRKGPKPIKEEEEPPKVEEKKEGEVVVEEPPVPKVEEEKPAAPVAPEEPKPKEPTTTSNIGIMAPLVVHAVAKPSVPEPDPEPEVPTTTTTTGGGGPCDNCASKDTELEALEKELAQLKEEKGELAKQVKKIKGSAKMNTELKEEIADLKQQLSKKDGHAEEAKAFHKLENKLNTLKMVVDGKVNKNDIDELRDHVSMISMVLNQDLKQVSGKNVWA